MTSPVNKKQQEAAARKEIAKRRQLRDVSESDSSSGSEAESDGDNPPADNAGKGNDDAEGSGDDDTNAEESGDKDSAVEESNEQVEDSEPGTNPEASRSIQEEPKIQINALNEVPKLKRLFEGYNMYWMAKTLGKYSIEMVCEFYANYYYTLEKKASSKKAIKKEPVLDFVRVRAIPVDISERTITKVLMGGDFTVPTRTTKYNYPMEAMKGIRKLRTEDKVLHFQ
ncbi:hypothetical protein HAX54_028712 [Datura stramonium]|uniref:Uncharacterized protein n=1 Tax=Datura stramonium TaxID=4076 RepID=A0ABS8V4V1_DATST|nr:hypothetical protein [Datura stramonium]